MSRKRAQWEDAGSSPSDGVELEEGGGRSIMLEEVEQDIDGDTAEEVDAVGAQERKVKGVARHLVAGP